MIIEDEGPMALGLVMALEHSGYQVEHYQTAKAGVEALKTKAPDLLLLDIMLEKEPDSSFGERLQGLQVLQYLRPKYPDLPIIMLSSLGSDMDQITGLDYGASDYVCKPFSLPVLLARIRSALRQTTTVQITKLKLKHCVVDLRRQTVMKGRKELKLTTHEVDVLKYLMVNEGRNVTRQELLKEVWGYDPSMQTRTIDNQILKLRKKVEKDSSKPDHVITVHGIGYRFESL